MYQGFLIFILGQRDDTRVALCGNVSFIWSEVQYAYTPNLGYVMTGTLTLSDSAFMKRIFRFLNLVT